MQRYGIVIKVKPGSLEEYKRLHADPWPEVNKILSDHGIRNFSIYERDGYLFGYFEFLGSDIETAFKEMDNYPIYKEWLSLNDPLQEPLPTRKEGEWWSSMDEIYHLD